VTCFKAVRQRTNEGGEGREGGGVVATWRIGRRRGLSVDDARSDGSYDMRPLGAGGSLGTVASGRVREKQGKRKREKGESGEAGWWAGP
jgi:hypothetical protein